MDEEVEGFRVVAQALARLGVKYMFGVVGIPVVEVGAALQHCSTAGNLLHSCSTGARIYINCQIQTVKQCPAGRWRWLPSRRG